MSIHFIKLKKATFIVMGVFLGTVVSKLVYSSNENNPVYYPGTILETAHADITAGGVAGDSTGDGGDCGDGGGGDCGDGGT